jgi:hypothetical protein
MISQAKINANRLNAQKSTGPRTAEGKAVVSKNGLRHGLLAQHDVIPSESEARFNRHRRQILNELNPITPMESMLAERIVTLSWRLRRAGRFQNQVIKFLSSDQAAHPLDKITESLIFKTLNRPQPLPLAPDDPLALGRFAAKDFADDRVLDRLLMYERRIEHSLFKTLLEFQRLNIIRKLESSAGSPSFDGKVPLIN